MNRGPAVQRTKTRVGSLNFGPDPVLMGVLNVTPDSFSDGGEFFRAEPAVSHAEKMFEELRRVLPVIQGILSARPDSIVSIDTYRSSIAEAALDAGARAVNDVTALGDPRMAGLMAERGCPIILMHMLGEPKSMQQDPRYEDVVREVRDFLAERAERAIRAGVELENIILDPGIGFGKALEHNLKLLKRLDSLVELGFPVLVGVSRKSFLGKITGCEDPKSRLFGTMAANVLAYERGANLFRVHDVRANKEALAVAAAIRRT